MKLTRKSIGRIAASFVATAMLATMAIVPASADTGVTTGDSLTSISIDKTLTKAADIYVPDVDFTFTVAPATADDAETATGTRNGSQVTMEVYNGVEGGVKTDNTNTGIASFAPAASDMDQTSVTEEATFTVDPTVFEHAGVYKYTVTETASTYEGITNDTTLTRTLYIYVENGTDNNYVVVGAVLKNGSTKTDGFTNAYGQNKNELNKLTISKTIAGNAANMEETFSFTVKIDAQKGATSEWYKYTTSQGDTGYLTSGKSTEFTLGNADTITIIGLSNGDSYTVTEAEANEDGYVTTAKIGETPVTLNDGSATGSITTDSTLAYTNTRDSSTPTGIMMDIAPYAVLVVIAAAGCFIFLRKRHTKED